MGFTHRYQRNRKQYNDLLERYIKIKNAREYDYVYNAKLHARIGALTTNFSLASKKNETLNAKIKELKAIIIEKDKEIKAVGKKAESYRKEAEICKEKLPEKVKKIAYQCDRLAVLSKKVSAAKDEIASLKKKVKERVSNNKVIVTVEKPIPQTSLNFLNTQLSWGTKKDFIKTELMLRAVVEYQNLIDSGKITQEEVAYLGTAMQMDSFCKEEITKRFGDKMTRKYKTIIEKLLEVGYIEKLPRMGRYFLTVMGKNRFNTILKYIYTKKPRTYFDTDESTEQ